MPSFVRIGRYQHTREAFELWRRGLIPPDAWRLARALVKRLKKQRGRK